VVKLDLQAWLNRWIRLNSDHNLSDEYLPKYLFIDTNVFHRETYNFSSEKLKTLISTAADRKLILIVTESVDDEVRRHMIDRTIRELVRLDKAVRSFSKNAKSLLDRMRSDHRTPVPEELLLAPEHIGKLAEYFLGSDTTRPSEDAFQGNWHALGIPIHKVANLVVADWSNFKKNLRSIKLGSEWIAINEVMTWYSQILPPFEFTKEKRKEFPDAFSISSLRSFSENKSISISVVSHDRGVQAACERAAGLIYFGSLDTFLESLVVPADLARIRTRFLKSIPQLNSELMNYTNELIVEHAESQWELISTEWKGGTIQEFRILAFTKESIVVSFLAEMSVLNTCVARTRKDTDEPVGEEKYGLLNEILQVSGLIKISPDESCDDSYCIKSLNFDSREIFSRGHPLSRV
jgi:predicted nucleic acid-binding protein